MDDMFDSSTSDYNGNPEEFFLKNAIKGKTIGTQDFQNQPRAIFEAPFEPRKLKNTTFYRKNQYSRRNLRFLSKHE